MDGMSLLFVLTEYVLVSSEDESSLLGMKWSVTML